MPDSGILVLGKIQGARGVQGKIRVIRRGDMLDGLKKNSNLQLYSAQGIKDGFLMDPSFFGDYVMEEFSTLTNDTVELKLKNLTNTDEAWKLKGMFIGIKLSEAKIKFHNPKDPYLFEYINLKIYEGDEFRGKVKRVDEYHSKQWLIGECGEDEVMIPLQGPYIENVDFPKGNLYIMLESGLFPSHEPA